MTCTSSWSFLLMDKLLSIITPLRGIIPEINLIWCFNSAWRISLFLKKYQYCFACSLLPFWFCSLCAFPIRIPQGLWAFWMMCAPQCMPWAKELTKHYSRNSRCRLGLMNISTAGTRDLSFIIMLERCHRKIIFEEDTYFMCCLIYFQTKRTVITKVPRYWFCIVINWKRGAHLCHCSPSGSALDHVILYITYLLARYLILSISHLKNNTTWSSE